MKYIVFPYKFLLLHLPLNILYLNKLFAKTEIFNVRGNFLTMHTNIRLKTVFREKHWLLK